jgi:hypothetical protein
VNDNGINLIVNQTVATVYQTKTLQLEGKNLKKKDHIEVAKTALSIIDQHYSKQIIGAYKKCSLYPPFNFDPYFEDPSRYSRGEAFRSKSSMPRTTIDYLKDIISTKNIALPSMSPIQLSPQIVKPYLPSLSGDDSMEIETTPQLEGVTAILSKIKIMPDLHEASVNWQMEFSDTKLGVIDDSPLELLSNDVQPLEHTREYERRQGNLFEQSLELDVDCSSADAKVWCAKWLLQQGYDIYGGFIRDYVIRDQEGHDIDCGIPQDVSPKEIFRDLEKEMKVKGEKMQHIFI